MISVLRFCANERIDEETANKTLNKLLDSYSAFEMENHWQNSMLYDDNKVFSKLVERFPCKFGKIYERIKASLPKEAGEVGLPIEGIPDSYVLEINLKNPRIDENGYVNIMVGLSDPYTLRNDFLEQGYKIRSSQGDLGVNNLAAEIGVEGWINTDPKFNTTKEGHIVKIQEKLIEQVKAGLEILKTNPEAKKVRIIMGRWSTLFSFMIGSYLGAELSREQKKDVIISSYLMAEKGSETTYQDYPLG